MLCVIKKQNFYCDLSATDDDNLVVISDYPCRGISEPMFRMGEKLKGLSQWVPGQFFYDTWHEFYCIIIQKYLDVTSFICIKPVCFANVSCAGKLPGGKSALCKLELRTTFQKIMWQRSIMGVFTSKLLNLQCQNSKDTTV